MSVHIGAPRDHVVDLVLSVRIERGADITEEVAIEAANEAFRNLGGVRFQLNDIVAFLTTEANRIARQKATDIQFAREPR